MRQTFLKVQEKIFWERRRAPPPHCYSNGCFDTCHSLHTENHSRKKRMVLQGNFVYSRQEWWVNCVILTDPLFSESELSKLCRLADCLFFQTSLSSKLATRVAEAGFDIAFDPPADGKCFYYAASSQIGFSPSTLTAVIFEYLKNHQFDVSNLFLWPVLVDFIQEMRKDCLGFHHFDTIALMPCFLWIFCSWKSPVFSVIKEMLSFILPYSTWDSQ